MQLTKNKIEYLAMFRSKALNMKFALGLLTRVRNRPVEPSEPGVLFLDGDTLKYLDTEGNVKIFGKDEGGPPVRPTDTFMIDKTLVTTYEGKAEETTVGRYLLYAGVIEPTMPDVPYPNKAWSSRWLEGLITDGLRMDTLSVQNAKSAIDRIYRCGMFSNMVVPTASEKSFTTDPEIVKRKKELLEKYAGQLDDPLIVAKIEDELITMDKKWVSGDPAADYYNAMGEKSFSIHRKKMFITLGGVEEFNEKGAGYVFIMNSLAEGWDPADFANLVYELG